MKYFIGVDLGGTNIVCGLINREFAVLAHVKRPTERHLGYEHVIQLIVNTINQLLIEKDIRREDILAVGAGIPGFIDPEQGICILAGNLQWQHKPVASDLTAKLGFLVFINNDVRMFTLGEAVKGAGRGFRNVFGITLGTGMAAGMICDGQLFYGGGYMAGEIGHFRMDGEDAACGCGRRGCLETVASATGIARVAKERLRQGVTSQLTVLSPDMDAITAAHVSQAYDMGDPLAKEIMNHAGHLLGKALPYATHLISPDIIIIGGGAALAGERLFEPMRKKLQIYLVPHYWERLQIRLSELSDQAALIGSAIYAYQRVLQLPTGSRPDDFFSDSMNA